MILNNIANARTNGYKRRLISFESASDRPMTPAGGDDPTHYSFAAPIEAGARLAPALVDMTPGKLARTNRSMDLAIDGQGFFVVTDAKTGLEAFTRRGRFSTNASRKIVLTSAGREWVLTPPITVGADVSELEVGADGTVRLEPEQPIKRANRLHSNGRLRIAVDSIADRRDRLHQVLEDIGPDQSCRFDWKRHHPAGLSRGIERRREAGIRRIDAAGGPNSNIGASRSIDAARRVRVSAALNHQPQVAIDLGGIDESPARATSLAPALQTRTRDA